MTYPKPFMGIPELMKMGLTREFLNQAIASPGQTFASRVNPKKKKSPYLFDTEGFEKWRLEQIQIEQKAMKMRGGVM